MKRIYIKAHQRRNGILNVTVSCGAAFLDFIDIPYEEASASAVVDLLKMLQKEGAISLFSEDPSTLDFLEKQ